NLDDSDVRPARAGWRAGRACRRRLCIRRRARAAAGVEWPVRALRRPHPQGGSQGTAMNDAIPPAAPPPAAEPAPSDRSRLRLFAVAAVAVILAGGSWLAFRSPAGLVQGMADADSINVAAKVTAR